MLHRASCPEVRKRNGKPTHYTTGRHLKACPIDEGELNAWSREQTATEPGCCSVCRPHEEPRQQAADANTPPRLTRLAREILNFVLEVAVIHLENSQPTYRLTVADVANCFSKTPAQVTRPILQLWNHRMVTVSGRIVPGRPLEADGAIYPTTRALRTLPAFAEEAEANLDGELRKLTGAASEVLDF
jgi:hypothetical protein